MVMNYFDQVANMWDDNPIHFERSKAIATKILDQCLLTGKKTALEFGAGTGILSVMLSNELSHISLMDSSIEMIKIIRNKIDILQLYHLEALHFDLVKDNFNQTKFDAIFTQMVLHHVSDIDTIFKKFYNMLNPQGVLIIADLYPEDGSFHGPGFNGHKGFNPGDLSGKLKNIGFNEIEHDSCFNIRRVTKSGEAVYFQVFLLTAHIK
jgi:ubiquinone/menaquinone biosynthesis C-methylase UbiE